MAAAQVIFANIRPYVPCGPGTDIILRFMKEPLFLARLRDQTTYMAVRAIAGFIGLLPRRWQLEFVGSLVRLATIVVPRFRRIASRNLSRAFPDKDEAWHRGILTSCHRSFARLIVDFLSLESIGPEDVRTRFDFGFAERLAELTRAGVPVILATGHLGSFEVLAHYLALWGLRLAFVTRKFRPEKLDLWWKRRREANGNRVIDRAGALKGALRYLKDGYAVGVLFDQNVTRQHAVFVDWFGHPAATTKLIGLAATRTRATVMVISIASLDDDRYRIDCVECNFDSLYDNQQLTTDEKVFQITQQITKEYETMIRRDPGNWFWMHRRWKTAPEGKAEDFYAGI